MAKKKSEDVEVVIRPVGKMGGLDSIHIALIALVVILVLLLFVISGSKAITVVNTTNTTTSLLAGNYTCSGGVCKSPFHNQSQVRDYMEQVLASYNFVSGPSSLIPYFSDVSNSTYSYVPKSDLWYVSVPATNPSTGIRFYELLTIYDSNLTLDTISIETARPSIILSNKVVTQGVMLLSNKFACMQQNPVQVYWFMDPYAPGAIASLNNVSQLKQKFANNVNVSVKIVFKSPTAQIANTSGLLNAQALGRYVLCASTQQNFSRFSSNLQAAYGNSYLSSNVLASIARSSGLDVSALNTCMSNSTPLINTQTLLASYYNITTTPMAVVNCKYLALPQTAQQAVCHDNSTLCRT